MVDSPMEDQWVWNEIDTPFPDNPVKVVGQQNQYVALWYKNGKPCNGRAWNDGGVVKCSFACPISKSEQAKKSELGGQIQILQYKGDHLSLGFWYNWIPYSKRPALDDKTREIVKCGNSIPILWHNRPEGSLLGFVDNDTEIAYFACDGKYMTKEGGQLSDFMIIVREYNGGPPGCFCSECAKGPIVRATRNEWRDFRVGDLFPNGKFVRALDRSLSTLPGEDADQFVALWYQSGEPVMGRVWNQSGKIAASFSLGGREYKTNIGSIQVLCELPEQVRSFDYAWKDFKEAAQSGWYPMQVNHHKGNISPCVLIIDGKEVLGKADVRNERASIGYGGSEKILAGPAVRVCKVLCRKTKPGCKC